VSLIIKNSLLTSENTSVILGNGQDGSLRPNGKPAKVYFENLNAIRFIAAFLVIIHHTEQFKSLLKLPNHWSNPVIEILGPLGVVLFFVLSGFLISYLLFTEKDVTGTISIKDFYIRRVLRIWPLYFLIVLAAFFVFPFVPFFTLPDFPRSVVWDGLFTKLTLYVLFLPNVALHALGTIPYASQAWSIGAEEQFYLIWPGLNKWVKNKWLLMSGVIVGYLLIRSMIGHASVGNENWELVDRIWNSTPIDCMAIGGMYAIILYENSRLITVLREFIFSKAIQWAVLSATILLILRATAFPHLHSEIYATLFGLLICNFAANPRRIFSMEYAWTGFLGKISYGLYMFHPIVIVLSIRLLQKAENLQDSLLYPMVFALVILLATVSFNFFEKRFITLKAKYAKILSGNEAKEAQMNSRAETQFVKQRVS
jgi:peptidoglycan/LPS O-acetylase OafA/YrhL